MSSSRICIQHFFALSNRNITIIAKKCLKLSVDATLIDNKLTTNLCAPGGAGDYVTLKLIIGGIDMSLTPGLVVVKQRRVR